MVIRRKKKKPTKKEVIIDPVVEIVEHAVVVEDRPICISRGCSNYPANEGLCQKCRNDLRLNG